MSGLPPGWALAGFLDAFDVQGGTQPPKSTFVYSQRDGYVQLLQIRDFGGKPVPTFIPDDAALKKCEAHDILIARYGASLGRILTGLEGAYNVAMAKVVIPEGLNRRYVFHLLNSRFFQEPLHLISRSAQNGFNKTDLQEFKIPLAPCKEQKRIAAKLDALLAQVDSCRERLDRVPGILKRFRQSVLAAATSGRLTEDWRAELGEQKSDTVTLGSLILEGPKNGLYKPASAYGSGTRILRIDNFYDGNLNAWEDLKRLEVSSKEADEFSLAIGDIVVNRVNSLAYLGKSALIRELPEACVFESNMMRIRLQVDVIRPTFAILVLTSPDGLSELRRNAKHAVNQASINQGDVCSVRLRLPSLDEQQEIVRRVEILFAYADELEARVAAARAQVERLTPAILAKAFRGELVPQDPNDESAEVLLERLRAENAGQEKKRRGRRA